MKTRMIVATALVATACSIGAAWLVQIHRKTLDAQCIENLRVIDAAKHQWALENFALPRTNPWGTDYLRYFNAIATEEDIHLYNSRNQNPMPQCPRGGKYTIGRTIDDPACSFPGHALPKDFDPVPGFLHDKLADIYFAGASELVIEITPQNAEGTPLKCKVGSAWHVTTIPSYLRARLLAELQREAGLSTPQFPMEGDVIVPYRAIQIRWHLRIGTPDGECRMTAPSKPELNEKRDKKEYPDAESWEAWNQFTNRVHSDVAREAKGLPPNYPLFKGTWKELWERAIQNSRLYHLDPARRIAYIKSERINAGLPDFDETH